MIFRKYFSQLILIPVLAGPLSALAAPAYEAVFAPAGFYASQMNNRGQVIGNFGDQPAIWNRTGAARLTALEGHLAFGINNRGDIVGTTSDYRFSFVYTRAGIRYISIEQPWNYFNRAAAINDAGQVVGYGSVSPRGSSGRALLNSWRGTELIHPFGGDWSDASSINAFGHVVGNATLPSDGLTIDVHAFLYRNGVLKDLGTLGGSNSFAADINDAGQIVGASNTAPAPGSDEISGPSHAFLYLRGTMKDLGTLGGTYSWGSAINNAGVAVGQSYLAEGSQLAAFVYARGKMTDLNTQVRLPEGWTLVETRDINDKGQILAHACSLEDCGWARLSPRHAPWLSSPDDEKELDEPDDAGDEE